MQEDQFEVRQGLRKGRSEVSELTEPERNLVDVLEKYRAEFERTSADSIELRRVSYFLTAILGSDADGKTAFEKVLMVYEKLQPALTQEQMTQLIHAC